MLLNPRRRLVQKLIYVGELSVYFIEWIELLFSEQLIIFIGSEDLGSV
jgi:hypothetical protein